MDLNNIGVVNQQDILIQRKVGSCPCRFIVRIEKWNRGLCGDHFVMALLFLCFSCYVLMLRANLMVHSCSFIENMLGRGVLMWV